MSEQKPVDQVLNIRARLGEGPVWCGRRNVLFWTDIHGKTFNRFDPVSGRNLDYPLEDFLCAFCLMEDGRFLCAFSKTIAIMDETGCTVQKLMVAEADQPDNRFNDGKCDRHGHFLVGTMNMTGKRNAGALYRFDPDGSLHRVLAGLSTSNGLGWSPDGGTFYLTDSPAREIYAFDYDGERGRLANRRVLVTVAPDRGRPDGLTVDREGGIWSANWDGWCVTRYLPDGSIDRILDVPVPRPTSVMIGGSTMNTLYVTSARTGLEKPMLDRSPMSGSIFTAQLDEAGIAEPYCACSHWHNEKSV